MNGAVMESADWQTSTGSMTCPDSSVRSTWRCSPGCSRFRMRPVGGDVLEIGSFFGRSALLLEYLKDEQEVLHVCDLFEGTPSDGSGPEWTWPRFHGDMATRSDFEECFGASRHGSGHPPTTVERAERR